MFDSFQEPVIVIVAMKRLAHIYFVQEGLSGPIKIGMARDIVGRLDQIMCSNASEVHLVALIPGGLDVERELHNRFAKFHIRGEWFKPDTALLEFISGLPDAALRDVKLRRKYSSGRCSVEDARAIWGNPELTIREAMPLLRGWTHRALYKELGPRPAGCQGRRSAQNGRKSKGRPKKKS